MEIDYKLLGERIQEVRKTRHIKQYGLAESVGVSGPFMSQVESGKKQLSLENFIQIADALDVTADTLLIGNQKEVYTEYQSDIYNLLSDCSLYEKKIIYGLAYETKRLLKENRFFRQ